LFFFHIFIHDFRHVVPTVREAAADLEREEAAREAAALQEAEMARWLLPVLVGY
jgi:hypothetical protein